jgi:serine protease Do
VDEFKAQDSEQSEHIYADFSVKEDSKRGKGGKKLLSVLLIVLLSGGAGFGGGMIAQHHYGSTGSPGSANIIKINTEDNVNTAEAVAAKVIPSVVGISTTTEMVKRDIFGFQSGRLVEGVGTGIIADKKGFILTNSHVVSDGKAKTITVQLTDGRELKGEVLWNDKVLDLAMVKIDADNLTPAELGDSDEVNIGAYAVAIGNPLGMAFDRSVTQGVISGLNRTINVGEQGGSMLMEGLMQTDASINAGNSGGPLLNSKGQVIGINTAKAPAGEGLGFAIPINTAKPIIHEIMETGVFNKAFIGISGTDMEIYLQNYPEDDLGTKTGVYVRQIYPETPADTDGLLIGDVIVAIDGKKIRNMEGLTRELFSYKPGEKVKISLYRKRHKTEIDLTLGVAD